MNYLRLVFVLVVSVIVGLITHYVNKSLDGAAAVGVKTMQAITFKRYGTPDDVLEIVDLPVPNYRSWEVLVEVYTASINPADYKIIEGAFYLIDYVLNHRVGFDFCGKVVAVGLDVQGINVGDVVHGMAWIHKTGSLAEYIATDESAINVIPSNMSIQEAAGLPLVAHTSYSSLVTLGKVDEKSRVLILGGSSATGLMALQLAKAYGAEYVTTTCSPRNDILVKSLGADEVVNYHDKNVFDEMLKNQRTFDIIYDTVGAGKSAWEGAASGVLAQGGRMITITGDVQRTLDISELVIRGYQIASRNVFGLVKLGGASYHQYTQPGGNSQDLAVLDNLFMDGKLKVIVDRSYNFDLFEVKQAFSYLMTGHACGKIIINIKAK